MQSILVYEGRERIHCSKSQLGEQMHWSLFGNCSCVTLPPASMQSWESRFKSQALLDERALLSCMVYVDLNPIRAKMAKSPETSDHTCVKSRITILKEHRKSIRSLEKLIGPNPNKVGLPFLLRDYLELVDWTGRIVREDKRGKIDSSLPPIIKRLSLDRDSWLILTTQFERQFGQWVGSDHIVRQIYFDRHYQRIPSTNNLL